MRNSVIGLLLATTLAMAGAAWGGTTKNVYLKDGGIIEAQSVWQKGTTVQVLVNRDTLVELPQGDVDLKKTFKAAPVVKKQKKPAAKLSAIRPAATQEAATAPAVAQASSPTADTPAKADSATTATKPAPTPAPSQTPAQSAAKPADPAPPQTAPEPPPKPSVVMPPMQEPPPEAPGFGMALAAMGMIPLLVVGLILLLFLITFWKIFEKAGEAGWKSLIPIYNIFIMIKIAGKPWWWFLLFLIPLVNIIFNLLWCLALAQKFGKSQLFGVGLFLLGFIFFPILAFDSSRYEG